MLGCNQSGNHAEKQPGQIQEGHGPEILEAAPGVIPEKLLELEQQAVQTKFYQQQVVELGQVPQYYGEQPISDSVKGTGFLVGFNEEGRILFTEEINEGYLQYYSIHAYPTDTQIQWTFYDQQGIKKSVYIYYLDQNNRIVSQRKEEWGIHQNKTVSEYQFTYFDEGGVLIEEEKDGNLLMKQKKDKQNRLVSSETYDEQGNQIRYHCTYYSDGSLKEDKSFLNDTIRSQTSYYPSGVPKEALFYDEEGKPKEKIVYNKDGSVLRKEAFMN